MSVTVEAPLGGKRITLEAGKLARQAGGAVVVRCEDTIVLVTAVVNPEPKPSVDFVPLTCDYVEKTFAAGKIPGGFFKREGRPHEHEVLTSRFIDRPIRPLFPEGYNHETQVIATVLSAGPEIEPDTLAMVGASAALTISEAPFLGPIAGVRVSRVNGEFKCNPSLDESAASDIELIVASTKDAVVMVEGEADEVPEEEIPASLRKALEARGLPRRLYAPSGCGFCSGIGYRGRQVVVELLVLTEQLRGLIARGSDEAALRREALKNGWLLPMAEDVYWHLSAGSTSWEEASALLEAESGGLASPKAAAANGPRKISKFPLAGRSILVVDDEAPVRNLIRRILEAYGCAVREASEGAEGLRMFAEQAPDLVVLDLNMPVMGGLDMIQAVRSRQRFWNVPILILTAAEGAQSQELALESGADDYVSKPFEAQVLLARVRALFRRLEWAEASERSAEDPALCALAAGAAVLRPDTGGA